MQNTTNDEKTGLTALTAINIAKVLTIILLLIFSFVFGIQDLRQVIYLCLHVSYCLWWLLEQWLFPQRRQIFSEPVGIGGLIWALLFVGVFYSLPGYLAFTNPVPLSAIATAVALPLYIFGTLINATADIQKLTAKQYGAQLVRDNIWRFSRNINYFGDLLRYVSFAVVASSVWAYLVPAVILMLYVQRISQKEQSMSAKYQNYADYQKSSSRLIPFVW
ncbi:MAG: steroid 5-alpha reductase [Mastigocladus sp. ERB_26_2]